MSGTLSLRCDFDEMTRRKDKQRKRDGGVFRQERIEKLIKGGWIESALEIPSDAIPVDPELVNLGGSYHRPTFYQDQPFTCQDCKATHVWLAEDQRWYFESSGAPYYQVAIRCRKCRILEKERKFKARQEAGYEPKD